MTNRVIRRASAVPVSVVVVLVIAACGPIQKVEDRRAYWTNKSDEFFQNQRSLQEVHSWLRSHNIIYTFDYSDIDNGTWAMTLEKVYIESWRCDWIDIQLAITIDSQRQISQYSLQEKRACLW